MSWRIAILVTFVASAMSACGQSPTAPATNFGLGRLSGAADGATAGPAGRKPAPTSSFGFRLVDTVDGYSRHALDGASESLGSDVIGDGSAVSLSGGVSGIPGSRVFTLSGGAITLRVRNVRPGHGQASNCDAAKEALLAQKGLIGVPVTGTVTRVRVDEIEDLVELTVDGVAGADGQTWRLTFFSSYGAHARITEEGGLITVVQDYGESGFRVPAPHGNKWGESYGCRVYFSFTLAPIS